VLILISKLLFPRIFYSLVNNFEGRHAHLSTLYANIVPVAFIFFTISGIVYQSQLWLTASFFVGISLLPEAVLSLAGYQIRVIPTEIEDYELIKPILSKQILNWSILLPFFIYLSQSFEGLMFLASGYFFAMVYNVLAIYRFKSLLGQ